MTTIFPVRPAWIAFKVLMASTRQCNDCLKLTDDTTPFRSSSNSPVALFLGIRWHDCIMCQDRMSSRTFPQPFTPLCIAYYSMPIVSRLPRCRDCGQLNPCITASRAHSLPASRHHTLYGTSTSAGVDISFPSRRI